LLKTNCHVFTFNYDQLFEIAFLESFKNYNPSDPDYFLYGQEVLNSGFNPYAGECASVNITAGRFCFLKLHGSAGWWVRREQHNNEGRRYFPFVPKQARNLIEIEKSIPKQLDAFFGCEPLMAFPDERHFSRQFYKVRGQSSGYLWAPYIDAIWEHAANLVANAAEIKVIGYSFNPIDSRYMIDELLNKATCPKIVIQNKDVKNVERNLAHYSQFSERLDFDSTPF